MIHVVLVEPEIPGNTGNIIRLSANTGAHLHLVEPLGFALEDKLLRRAGLDYHEWARVRRWASVDGCLEALHEAGVGRDAVFALTTKGRSSPFQQELNRPVALLFGSETRGLSQAIRERFAPQQWLRLPMLPDSRSLNLANCVAIMVYEAWRQQGFGGSLTE